MSLSIGAVLAAVGSAAGQAGSSLGSSWFNSILSDSNNKDSQARAETYSTKNLINEYLLGRQAVKEDAETNYDWSLAYARQRDQDQYSLAKRYTENSAAWQKQGMINADVNPILAYGSLGGGIQYSASNQGLTSASGGSPSADTPSSASPSASGGRGLDLAEIARDIKSIDNMTAQEENVKANTDTINALRDVQVSSAEADAAAKSSQAGVNAAQAQKILAEADNIKANTAKVAVDTALSAARQKNVEAETDHIDAKYHGSHWLTGIAEWFGNKMKQAGSGTADLIDTVGSTGGFPYTTTVEGHNSAKSEKDKEDYERENLRRARQAIQSFSNQHLRDFD